MRDRERDKVIKRANRQLSKVGQKLIVNRGRAAIEAHGQIHRINITTKEVVERNVNLDTIFHEREEPKALAAAA